MFFSPAWYREALLFTVLSSTSRTAVEWSVSLLMGPSEVPALFRRPNPIPAVSKRRGLSNLISRKSFTLCAEVPSCPFLPNTACVLRLPRMPFRSLRSFFSVLDDYQFTRIPSSSLLWKVEYNFRNFFGVGAPPPPLYGHEALSVRPFINVDPAFVRILLPHVS